VTVPQVAVGTIIGGKYRLVRYLAAGGMGTVYEAQHTVLKRRVALKLLHPELATKRDSLARFEREAQAAGSVESENVAAALDFGIAENGSPYLVLEYLAGESLRALLERCGRLPLARATDIVVQACRGVGAAHKAGIVHRDLNPQNIFVCRRDEGTDLVKVLDFGIAKLESSRSTETRTGTILGTPAYLAPEQARGEKNVDQRADVYGLGAVLYEMLAGEKPHPGESHNATLHHICTQPALPLDSERLGLPPALVDVVMSTLSSDPSGRPGSTDELAHKLVLWAKREVWPVPPAELSGAQASTAARADSTRGPATKPRRRRWLALGLAVLLIGSAAAGVFFRAGKRPAANMRRHRTRVQSTRSPLSRNRMGPGRQPPSRPWQPYRKPSGFPKERPRKYKAPSATLWCGRHRTKCCVCSSPIIVRTVTAPDSALAERKTRQPTKNGSMVSLAASATSAPWWFSRRTRWA
jgi:serine/threonine protein kinase